MLAHVEPEARARLLDRRFIDIADGDLGPKQVQRGRGGQPDAAGATGDGDDFSLRMRSFVFFSRRFFAALLSQAGAFHQGGQLRQGVVVVTA